MQRTRQIDYRMGDLFDHPFSQKELIYIAHVCNDKGGWGAGFVIPLAQHFPRSREEYIAWSKNLNNKYPTPFQMGKTQLVHDQERNVVVANMVAQTLGGSRPLRYDKLVECMTFVAERVRILTTTSLSLSKECRIIAPLFGSGLAGGDWNFIEKLIQDIWLSQDIPVSVYYIPKFLPSNWRPPTRPPQYMVRSDDSMVFEYDADWGLYEIPDGPLHTDGTKPLPSPTCTYETLINSEGVTFSPCAENELEEYAMKREAWYKKLGEESRKGMGCGDEGEAC